MAGGGTRDRWFNVTPIGASGSAFARPAIGTFGNLPRNALIGPGYWRTDASLFKRFALVSGQAIEFRVEAVNLFNHVNLGNPDSEIGVPGNLNPNAGRITSTAYGGADPQRNWQVAVQYIFLAGAHQTNRRENPVTQALQPAHTPRQPVRPGVRFTASAPQ